MLLVVRVLPADELGLQAIASTVLLTVAQMLRFWVLLPLTKFVAEGTEVRHVAATGLALYVFAIALLALAIGAGRGFWADLFDKPALARCWCRAPFSSWWAAPAMPWARSRGRRLRACSGSTGLLHRGHRCSLAGVD
jgi:hypothetical protein